MTTGRMVLALGVLMLLYATEPACSGDDSAPLIDPARPVTRITRTSFTLQYFTQQPCETRVQVREGDIPMIAWRPEGKKTDFWSQPNVRVVRVAGSRQWHTVTVDGLKPGKRYFYRVYDPGAVPTREEKLWGAQPPWRREYAVSTQAPKGYKTIIHVPVKVLLMPNVINVASAHDTNGVIAPRPQKLTPEQIALIRKEYEVASRFFWVNSRMRFWVDFQIFIDDRWQRWGPEPENVDPFYKGWPVCRSYPGEDFRWPGGGDFTIVDTQDIARANKEPVYEERPYPGQIEQAFPRRWTPRTQKWEFYNSGGGTYGVDELPNGIPARSQYLGGGDTAWLATHEFHHQMESFGAFSLAHREDDRIVFNHPEPRYQRTNPDGTVSENTWNTAGRHGEHWQCMAFWDRRVTDAQWLRMYIGYTITVRDADEDGVPDDDPRLPLDEKRFGSNPRKRSTDGRITDLQKVMLSTWAHTHLQSSYNKPPAQYILPKPNHPDSDGDGQTDDIDPYPLYPWQPFVYAYRPTLDGDDSEWAAIPAAGEMDEGGIRFTFKQAHDGNAYYGLFLVKGNWKRIYAVFDGEGKGVYTVREAVQTIEVLNGDTLTVRSAWAPAPGLKWKSSRKADGTTVIEFSLPNRGEGVWFWTRGGREVGASIDIAASDDKVYSVYEPYDQFYAVMLEPNGQFPFPANVPAEISRENATRVFLPGDPALKFTASGWKLENGALRHFEQGEAWVYIDGLNAVEFDLWVQMEAKMDVVLGAFLPGTEAIGHGVDYIAFVGGYGNARTRFRLFGREEGDGEVMVTPGKHTYQLSRRGGELWLLVDGKPVLYAVDPNPKQPVNRLAVFGGFGSQQVLYEVRIRVP
jgi:hypothetical protein